MYVESNTALLSDVFENFQNIGLEICKLDQARFLTASELSWQRILRQK